MAAAVVSVGVLQELVPADFRVLPRFVYPIFLLCFLGVLIIGDPGRIDRQRRWLRVTTLLMTGLITVVTAVSAVRLVVGILTNATFSTASQLLIIGGCISLTNVIAFALWYWDLDAGGAAARAAGSTPIGPAFFFPEMRLPEFVGASWYPKFADYLVLSFNTALAFSPTDVSAIRAAAGVAPHRCRSEGWTRRELPGPRAATTPDSATNLRQIIRPFTALLGATPVGWAWCSRGCDW